MMIEGMIVNLVGYCLLLLMAKCLHPQADLSNLLTALYILYPLSCAKLAYDVRYRYAQIEKTFENTAENKTMLKMLLKKEKAVCLEGNEDNGVFKLSRMRHGVTLHINVETSGENIKVWGPKKVFPKEK